ncbi:cytochrome ubiquinol oxidase subunit I [Actinacidiphila paucisporea]|uniref:Cytochrome bd-I ubiquinol oxidase subunit 1 apoprotein n=1 Tax=Actinacidiphila paucisporea TaxID=310782 RepID=A0A1M7Q9W8_9ACTN|nr:cytochrome ubiquinol oxidase subunit I [Actinacidiphila paucisporea]SHN27422.1 cytochrome bd-I ubiquinol oxidase subunit 1 apoprotein [Actinacidiphila paucisporea]
MVSTHSAYGVLAQAVTSAGDPSQLLPAREQMAFTLGFHIILVPFGVALTTLMLIANYRGLRHGDQQAMLLALRWSKMAAVLFAVGAVTGTVLSFELGLLWPGLMGKYGAAFGFPFAIEGIFFFLEAIFVSIYIYGWQRLPPWVHFWTGVPVVVSGLGGTASVVAANSWMNQPDGITVRAGRIVDVSPGRVFFNGAFWLEALHMFVAAYIVAGFVVAGVYAVGMLRGRRNHYHRLGFLIGFLVAGVAVPIQYIVGDTIARQVYDREPAKFAALEMLPKTATHVPETLLGVMLDGRPRYGLSIPSTASLLAGFRPSTRIKGLDAIAPTVRPDDSTVTVVHLAFDVMVGTASVLLLLVLWFAFLWWRRREVPSNRWFLRCAAVSGLLAVVCLESGWVTTEVGRQPWTVVGLLLTRDAVTTVGNLWLLFSAALVIYVAVASGALLVARTLTRQWQQEGDESVSVPYGPNPPLPDRESVTGGRP